MRKKYTLLTLISLLGALLGPALLTGCASSGPASSDPVTKESFYFDTICDITVYDMENMSQENAKEAIQNAFGECSRYESLLSKTKEGSDIWNINHAGGKPVECSNETIEVLEKGISYGNLSDGLFDITIGKAEDLWDFEADDPKVPDKEALSEAMSHVDYKNIVIDGKRVSLKDPEAEIDLGGIAKGYIADKIADYLRSENVTSAIISLGGNIEWVGSKPGENTLFHKSSPSDFIIGIETPYSDRSKIVGSTPVSDGTIVTSGVYERYFTIDGKEYHHILDVNTGYPVDSDILGVSVRADAGRSVDCDGLSTTCLILGVEKARRLIDSLDGFEALFIDRNNQITHTDDFAFTPADN